MAANVGEDPFAATVRDLFEAFLLDFSSDDEAQQLTSNIEEGTREYLEQLHVMKDNERTTLFVDQQHIQLYDSELADAIRNDFHHLEPHLRASVGKVMATLHEGYAAERDFYVAFFNLPHLCCVRELRTDKIASLVSFTATVTRTTDVRPELLVGAFTCELCGSLSDPVVQQFKYTEPIKCKNPSCVNRSEWALNKENSKFIDWQRVRVQVRAPRERGARLAARRGRDAAASTSPPRRHPGATPASRWV